MITRLLERFLGPNWRTSLYGAISALSGFATASNNIWVGWLQALFGQEWGKRIEAIFAGIFAFTLWKASHAAKDKTVTGTGSMESPYEVKSPSGVGDRPSVVEKPDKT